MHGLTVARGLEAHFEQVRCAEVRRLERKISALDPEPRAVVESVIADVVRGLVAQPAQVLQESAEPRLLEIVIDLFGIWRHRTESPAGGVPQEPQEEVESRRHGDPDIH